MLNIYCHTTLLLYYVQPKLVNVKLANKLQTVHQLHRGGEVLPNENHHSDSAAENVILNDYILTGFYYVRRSWYA